MAESIHLIWPHWCDHTHAQEQDSKRLLKAWRQSADWLFRANQAELAQAAYEKILIREDSALAHARLGHLHRFGGDFSRALQHLQAAVDLEPDNTSYRGLLGNMRLLMGEIVEGVRQLRATVSGDSPNAELHSSFLFSSHYLPDQDRQSLLAERRRWGQLHAPRSLVFETAKRDWDPERRLRVGYLSADFRQHSVGYTFAGVLNGRNREAVELYGYGSVCEPDAVTEQFRYLFDVYRDVYALDDATLARLIEADRIDILVAVAGHSFGNRLKVLAYKPAPIQVDYGAINTLGLEQVDYRITDSQLDPPASQTFFLEQLVYLPTGYVCYCPPKQSPLPGPLPAHKNGFVTFGCFNGAQKANRHVVNLWALVLRALPQSCLLIKCPGGDQAALRQHFVHWLQQAGVEAERVTVCGLLPLDQHLGLYHQVDIALDSYPFNGCVTSLEGLWMGVPVISLVGQVTVSRVGLTLLTQLGLGTFAARSADQYLKTAVALASDLQSLAQIRASLRQRMLASNLCNPARHARELEAAYRKMWRDYCSAQSGRRSVPREEVSV
jgi:predicted O-linked N-acetylglucosamine transferase (SPINDLY family)